MESVAGVTLTCVVCQVSGDGWSVAGITLTCVMCQVTGEASPASRWRVSCVVCQVTGEASLASRWCVSCVRWRVKRRRHHVDVCRVSCVRWRVKRTRTRWSYLSSSTLTSVTCSSRPSTISSTSWGLETATTLSGHSWYVIVFSSAHQVHVLENCYWSQRPIAVCLIGILTLEMGQS